MRFSCCSSGIENRISGLFRSNVPRLSMLFAWPLSKAIHDFASGMRMPSYPSASSFVRRARASAGESIAWALRSGSSYGFLIER